MGQGLHTSGKLADGLTEVWGVFVALILTSFVHVSFFLAWQVKDIHSALELEVFDEDRNKPPEFLGKVSIPLLTIRPGERRYVTVGQNNQECRLEYWATRPSVCSLTSLTPSLLGQWIIIWLFILCFFSILAYSVCLILPSVVSKSAYQSFSESL